MSTESVITQEMRNAIGIESASRTYEIRKDNMITFTESVRDLNPLFHDELAARKSRYCGLIASPTFLRSTAPGRLDLDAPDSFSTGIDGGSEFYYHEPVRPGDQITATCSLVDLFERPGRLGQMLFVIREIRYVNQFGQLAVRERQTGIRYQPPDQPSSKSAEVDASSKTRQTIAQPQEKRESNDPFFEDVYIGMRLPTVTKMPTTRQLVEYAAASLEFPEIHYDQDFARSVGLPDVIIQGSLKHAFLGHLVTGWIGESGTLKKLSAQYRRMDVPGSPIYCKGVVTKKYMHDNDGIVECNVWLENSQGEVTTPGTTTVMLPSNGA